MSAPLPCAVLRLLANGAILAADAELGRMLGEIEPPRPGHAFSDVLTAGSRVPWESQVLPAFAVRERIDEIYLRLRGATGEVPVLVNGRVDRGRAVPEITLVIVQMRRREQWEAEVSEARRRATDLAATLRLKAEELEAAIRELEESIAETAASYWMLERVADVLPLCMDCGMVRQGREWGSIVDFLKKNARFLSHGYCPECAQRFLEREGLAD